MHIPKYTYKSAKIKIRFVQISPGINIHVYGTSSKDSKEFKSDVLKGKPQPVVKQVYELDQEEAMIVVAHPE